jgi:hypothetical protein
MGFGDLVCVGLGGGSKWLIWANLRSSGIVTTPNNFVKHGFRVLLDSYAIRGALTHAPFLGMVFIALEA